MTTPDEKAAAVYQTTRGLTLGRASLAQLAGITEREARDFLARQEIHQLHSRPAKVRVQPAFDVRIPNIVHQADLLFLPTDDGYRYALVVVDAATRTIASRPLKTKQPAEVLQAFKSIYATELPLPEKLEVDPGTEFGGVVRAWFRSKGVFLRVGEPQRHRSQALVEAANKKIGTALLRRQTAEELLTGQPSREWRADLQPLVKQLNDRLRKPPAVRTRVLATKDDVLPAGTRVRLQLDEPRDVNGNPLHGRFRAADPRFSTKVHTVRDVWIMPGKPPLYWVMGKPQTFVRERLLPVTTAVPPPWSLTRGQQYVAERLLERRKVGGLVEYLVQWAGYPLDQATWEPRTALIKQVPDIVKRDEPGLRGG